MQKELNKFEKATSTSNFKKLSGIEQKHIKYFALKYAFSFQEIRIVVGIANDLNIWNEKSITEYLKDIDTKKTDKKQVKKDILKRLNQSYEELKNKPNSYKNFISKKEYHSRDFKTKTVEKDSLGLGYCPVASERTRCCNLLTLDAVESCGFDCSYCSIQSFYNQNQVIFNKNFSKKLKEIKLDPKKRYHIGTGQSSDSLMWGNKEGVLDALFEFAKKNPNVILEFKTKSNNIKYLLNHDVPKNIVATWSLNTPTIIKNEEHLTANLHERLISARRVADKGVKVGFHFHPIVHYENYLEEYKQLWQKIQKEFSCDEVTMISFGTLTYIKPVLKQIRAREFKSKIYQMPLVDTEGKLSYPDDIKTEMFKTAYNSFKNWHGKVFFYLCMEPHRFWKETFGYEYQNNEEFEKDMIDSYFKKAGL